VGELGECRSYEAGENVLASIDFLMRNDSICVERGVNYMKLDKLVIFNGAIDYIESSEE
jgi:hypothetical protein